VPRQVEIAAGKSNVQLPNGFPYQAGDIVTLTDQQFSTVPKTLIPTTLLDRGEIRPHLGHGVRVVGTKTNVVLPNGQTAATGDSYDVTERQYQDLASAASGSADTATDDKLYTWAQTINLASLANGRVTRFKPGLPNFVPRTPETPAPPVGVTGLFPGKISSGT
jgi:hypothetical protein